MHDNDVNMSSVSDSEPPVAPPFMVVADGAQEEPREEPEAENPFIAANGMKTVVLYRPLTVNGRELTELTLDFNRLTAADLDNIEAEMNAAGSAKVAIPAMSSAFCLRVAARASGVNHHELGRMNIKDASKVSFITQNFLLG